MNQKSFDFLKTLVEAPSPSGFETPAQEIVRKRMKEITKDIDTDVMGNVTGVLNKGGSPKIMLAGHCDEIGFMVKYISDEGYLYFTTIGGVDAHLIPGRRVYIHSAKGKVLGVIGKKPIHLMEEEEKKKISKIHDMWIDIGAKDKKEAQKMVEIGDPITWVYGLEVLKDDLLVSRAFDDKMGSFIVVEILAALKGKKFNASVYGTSTVQEEVGLRGAKTSAFRINPDIGICFDVTFATDFPSVDKKKAGECKVGGGPEISRGANINPKLFDLIIETARKEKIPYQISGAPRGTGTDANVMQLSRHGVATALISVPLRYMHTPVELLSTKDLDNTIKLVAALIKRIPPNINLTPGK